MEKTGGNLNINSFVKAGEHLEKARETGLVVSRKRVSWREGRLNPD